MLENAYQTKLLARLRHMFPGIIMIKNDSSYLQGFPDWTLFYRKYWAVLEIKASERAPAQPNQAWYIETLDNMGGFAAFIYPENEEEVLRDLQQAFQPRRKARLS